MTSEVEQGKLALSFADSIPDTLREETSMPTEGAAKMMFYLLIDASMELLTYDHIRVFNAQKTHWIFIGNCCSTLRPRVCIGPDYNS